MLFMLTYSVAAGDRFINIEFQGQYIWVLRAHIFLQQSQGFLNAIIYGCNKKVREQIKQQFTKKIEKPKNHELFKFPNSLDSTISSLSLDTSGHQNSLHLAKKFLSNSPFGSL